MPLPPDAELRARMIDYIVRRDRVSKETARQAIEDMTAGMLTRLDMEMGEGRARYIVDYDPFGRTNR